MLILGLGTMHVRAVGSRSVGVVRLVIWARRGSVWVVPGGRRLGRRFWVLFWKYLYSGNVGLVVAMAFLARISYYNVPLDNVSFFSKAQVVHYYRSLFVVEMAEVTFETSVCSKHATQLSVYSTFLYGCILLSEAE